MHRWTGISVIGELKRGDGARTCVRSPSAACLGRRTAGHHGQPGHFRSRRRPGRAASAPQRTQRGETRQERKRPSPTRTFGAILPGGGSRHGRAGGSSKTGLPADIADAVVQVESNYNPRVIGGVGEIGLMQIRPQTAAMLGFRGSAEDLAKPEVNIHYGVTYLSKAWRLANGDLCRTLMKYRAGHGEEVMTRAFGEAIAGGRRSTSPRWVRRWRRGRCRGPSSRRRCWRTTSRSRC